MALAMDIFRRKFSIGSLIVFAVLLVAVNAIIAYRAVGVLEQAQSWVQHTYQVIAQVEIIMGSAKDAETGERGYQDLPAVRGRPQYVLHTFQGANGRHLGHASDS